MKKLSKIGLSIGALLLAGQALAQITFYERDGFRGRSFATAGDRTITNLESQGFNDRASSVIVAGRTSERWEVCEDSAFRGRCVVLRPGEYASLGAIGLNDRISSVRAIPASQRVAAERYAPLPGAVDTAPSTIEFFAREGFAGRSFAADAEVSDFRASRFNDRASSVVITGGPWELCSEPGFGGRCVVFRPGRYPSLAAMQLDGSVSSARAVGRAAAPPTAPANQIVFYENEGMRGGTLAASSAVADFRGTGLNNRASAAIVTGVPWEVCQGPSFSGRCVVLRPGQYSSLAAMGLNDRVSSARIYVAPPAAPALPVVSQIIFYESTGFKGRSYITDASMTDLRRVDFNDRPSSVVVRGTQWWEVCEDLNYNGRCVVLRPGEYPSLDQIGLANRITSVRAVTTGGAPSPAPGAAASQILLYEGNDFQGRRHAADSQVPDLRASGYNDLASSIVIQGDQWWEVCEDLSYTGRCVVLRPGRYQSLAEMGMTNRITSMRPVAARADTRAAPAIGDYRRRDNERLYTANVTMVRAIVGDNSGQRCWIERGQTTSEKADPNVQGAVIGAVLGGILGHQVGGGTGRDVATGLGVIAGAAIGANTGRKDGNVVQTQDVQRCSDAPAGVRPAYYDVTYNFRGQEYKAQMSEAPGATLTVNERGEPRV